MAVGQYIFLFFYFFDISRAHLEQKIKKRTRQDKTSQGYIQDNKILLTQSFGG